MTSPSTATPATSPFDLHGRCAVVTGASRGIGRAIALGLTRAGAEVVLVGRPGSNDATREAVVELGGKVDVVDLDMGDLAAVEQVGGELASSRQVDVVVNNAGIIDRQDSVDVTREDWQRVLDVNLNGVFLLCQLLGRPMVARGHGKIVSIASLLSFQGGIRVPSYTASKSGLAGLTRLLACEWAAKDINVNGIAPGSFATNNTEALRADETRNRDILARIPAGRWGDPSDLSGAAVFLASDAAAYVHGTVLAVDGGWLAR